MEGPHLHSEEKESAETDERENSRLFCDLPQEKMMLFANHLMRPDGFVKTLVAGEIATSEELEREFGSDFVKTHRGYYMSYPRQGAWAGRNDYVSFNVGLPQRLYQESSSVGCRGEWARGLGFIFSADLLLRRENVEPGWEGFDLHEAVDRLRKQGLGEPQFERYYGISSAEGIEKMIAHPEKKDFLTRVHMARKAGMLSTSRGDVAEINMQKGDTGHFPRLSLRDGIILIPQNTRPALLRYVDKKIKELQRKREKLIQNFGVNPASLDAAMVLEKYRNIYWYPQENIRQAVEFLSTHPEFAKKF